MLEDKSELFLKKKKNEDKSELKPATSTPLYMIYQSLKEITF